MRNETNKDKISYNELIHKIDQQHYKLNDSHILITDRLKEKFNITELNQLNEVQSFMMFNQLLASIPININYNFYDVDSKYSTKELLKVVKYIMSYYVGKFKVKDIVTFNLIETYIDNYDIKNCIILFEKNKKSYINYINYDKDFIHNVLDTVISTSGKDVLNIYFNYNIYKLLETFIYKLNIIDFRNESRQLYSKMSNEIYDILYNGK